MVDVCIAIGHGHRSDGTFDPGTTDGPHNEQRDTKPVARACTTYLRTHTDLDVVAEHEMDRDPNWPGTRDWANRLRCRVLVSFHFDFILAPIGAFAIQTTDESRRLGWAIEARVADAGFVIREYPDDRDNLGLLNGADMPTVIFECGRIGSDPIDETHEQAAMGEAAARGIMDYLGIDPADEEDIMASIDDLRAAIRAELADERAETAEAVWRRHWNVEKDVRMAQLLSAAADNADRARQNSLVAAQSAVKSLVIDRGVRTALEDLLVGTGADPDAVIDVIVDRLTKE